MKCIAFFTIFLINLSFANNIVIKEFWHPFYQGKALNYCFSNKICGAKIANLYCKKLGFLKAARFIKAPAIGFSIYLDNTICCKDEFCDGFTLIACQNKLTKLTQKARVFYKPRYRNVRVAWCDYRSCGRAVAHNFCKRIGFTQLKSFKKSYAFKTRQINSKKLCVGRDCPSFKLIKCSI